MITRILASMFALLLLSTHLAGQTSPEADPDNAATYYNQMRGAYDAVRDEFTQEQWNAYWAYEGSHDGPPPQIVRDVLRESRPLLRLLEQASSSEYNDFNLDYDKGIELLLPHLSPMRQAARLAQMDARVRLADGDSRGAARRLSQIMTMSADFENDQTLIGTLVATSVYAHTTSDGALGVGIDQGLFSQADAEMILKSIDEITASGDPFGFAAAIEGEKEFFASDFREKYSGEGGTMRLLEDFGGAGFMADAQLEEITAMSQNEMDSALQAYEDVMGRAAEIARGDHLLLAREQMRQLEAEVETGMHGPIAMMMMASMDKVFETMLRVYADLDKTIDQLETIAESPDGALKLKNAALWYVRAAEALAEAEPTWRDAAYTTVAQIDHEPVARALELVQEGSKLERCDFSMSRSRREDASLTELAALVDIGHLLVDRSRFFLARGDNADAGAAHLIASLRLGAHLAQDEALLSSLAAEQILTNAREHLPLDPKALGDAAPAFAQTVQRAGEHRDFGYARAREAERRLTAKWLDRIVPIAKRVEARRLVMAFNANQLVSIGPIRDASRYWEPPEGALRDSPLMQAIDTAMIEPVRDASAATFEAIREGDLEALRNFANEYLIADIARRMDANE